MKSCKKQLIPSNACGIVSIILKNRPLIGFAKTHFDSCMNGFQFPEMAEKILENLKNPIFSLAFSGISEYTSSVNNLLSGNGETIIIY